MDGENSCESDISESWSLIDINLNEESFPTSEAFIESEKNVVENTQNEKLKVTNETDLENFLKKYKEINKTDVSLVSDSDSDSFNNQGLPSKNNLKPDSKFERNLENIGKHDSCDAESIEILDMDSNCSDSEVERLDISQINHLSFSTYQSDDEESLEGNDNKIRSNNSPVIKRKRRRLTKSLEETVNSINSENKSSTNNNLSVDSVNRKKDKLNEESNKVRSHPVYKHYRNNVANTVLSLSVGVIFAGVACIAIGHFLGVQDAAQTAVELVETLKKLEVENAALQSHLHQLNGALRIGEINPKSERHLNQAESKDFCQPILADLSKGTNSDFSGIHSNGNSIEELSKYKCYAQKNNKVTDTEYGIDFNEFGKFIQDQLHSLKTTQEKGAKILEEADKKISKELKEILNRLTTSQKDMASLNENVIRLKNIIDKIEKVIPESLEKLRLQSSKLKQKIPVTELDLQTMNWSPKKEMKSSDETYREPVTFYEYPKVESYYKKDVKSTWQKNFEFTNSNFKKVLKNDTSEEEDKVLNRNKQLKNERKKKEEKKHSKESWKKKEFKEKERKAKKIDKKQKRVFNKMEKVFNPAKERKERAAETKHTKIIENSKFNRTIHQNKKFSYKNAKTKRKPKKLKNLNKILLSKLRKESSCLKKNDRSRGYSGPELFNLTGNWIFKWADGREEIRKYQTLGDWQFERAKARKELREDEYEENWQFKRAEGRETNRNDVRGKSSKYTGKEFFHEGFSWI